MAATESRAVGVILSRGPAVSRWAPESWMVAGLIPQAGPGEWRELRREGDRVIFHAATLTLILHRKDTEAYLTALNAAEPSLFVVLRREGADRPEPLIVTASAHEAMNYCESGDEQVERIAAPPALAAWIADFCGRHHVEEPFIKRKRRPYEEAGAAAGRGDARIRQAGDVYRAPGDRR